MLLKISSSEITWYEDSNIIEWWIDDEIHPDKRRIDYYTLKEAIELAKFNKITLYIQPEFQDQNIIIDYSEGGEDE